MLSINNYSYKYQDDMEKDKGTFSHNRILAEKQAGMELSYEDCKFKDSLG